MEKITEVAKYFLTKESMTHKKLQKLCYYAQAWHLANYKNPLFPNHFEAWVHGPVSPELYSAYREWGWLPIPQVKSDEVHLANARTSDFLNLVYNAYGEFSGDQLENITHQEDPWRIARSGYSAGEYCRNMISMDDMKLYYAKRIGK